MPTAVFCATSAWRAPVRVGTHHFADYLVRRGWKVRWFSGPLTPLHLVAGWRRPEVRAKIEAWRHPTTTGLAASTPFTMTPMGGPLGFRSRVALRHWHQTAMPSFRRAFHASGRPDLLFVDSPLYWFAPRLLVPRRTAYRITDYTPGFGASPAFLECERDAVRAADVVMVPTPSLADYARSLDARRVVVVPNGVDVARFADPAPEPVALRDIPHPRAVYVGSLREWFDYDLVNRLVGDRPNVSVVVVGPDDVARQRLRARSSLHLLGPRDHADVPSFLHASDVALIPFDVRGHRELVESVDPLKLYEYLAAGLPVVASRWSTLDALASPALLADTHGEFVSRVDEALARRDDLADAGRRFAAAADWAPRFDRLLGELGLDDVAEDTL